MSVSIVGGAGHVGLPLGLVLATAGAEVNLIDKNEHRLGTLAEGRLPFDEPHGKEILSDALESERINLYTELDGVADGDVLIVVIGTPMDSHQNPRIQPLLDIIEGAAAHLRDDHLILLRSTVYPGTTRIVREKLGELGYVDGEDVSVAFAPERTTQHNAIEEIVDLPQLVGAFHEESYQRAASFFESFLNAEIIEMQPTEAELGKLFTNMWRYFEFAAANEFYLITESFAGEQDLNTNRILDKTAHKYPRFDVPSPGANVGGPCLTKDGWFLVDNIPYNELFSVAYSINEGMPAQILDRMTRLAPAPEKVAILGMTFKSNSDDTRNSVAFKLKKQLRLKGFSDVVCVEPNVEGRFRDLSALEGADWVVLMTPHDQFADLERILDEVDNEDCLYCDIWGAWNEMKYRSDNGYFFGEEVRSGMPHEETGSRGADR